MFFATAAAVLPLWSNSVIGFFMLLFLAFDAKIIDAKLVRFPQSLLNAELAFRLASTIVIRDFSAEIVR
jgi:hypothetical protein